VQTIEAEQKLRTEQLDRLDKTLENASSLKRAVPDRRPSSMNANADLRKARLQNMAHTFIGQC
jgi:hypothetical protein